MPPNNITHREQRDIAPQEGVFSASIEGSDISPPNSTNELNFDSDKDEFAGHDEAPITHTPNTLSNLISQWKILLFGQCLAFLLAATGASQASLKLNCNLSAPSFTVGLFYAVLSLSLIPSLFEDRYEAIETEDSSLSSSGHRDGPETAQAKLRKPYSLLGIFPLQTPAYRYLPMAIIDVYANYLTVMAFKYTTITSVTLLDALAIPSSLILSRIFLKRKYDRIHFIGVLSCIMGIVCNFVQDYDQDRKAAKHGYVDSTYPHKMLGDFLAASGGILFGVNNCLSEHAVRNLGGPNELNGVLGFFAGIISLTHAFIFERNEIADFVGEGDHSQTCSEGFARWILVGFIASNVCGYLGTARFLQISEATFLNLSLLSGDLWSVIFSVFAEGIKPHPFFFVALTFTMSGVIIYEMAPTPVLEDRDMFEERNSDQLHPEELVGDLELT